MGFFNKPGQVVEYIKPTEASLEKVEMRPANAKVEVTPQKVELPKFEFKEAEDQSRIVVVCYGEKGSGKTVSALSFPGNISVLCLDQKSLAVKKGIYKNDSRLKVYDVVEYFEEDPMKVMDTGVKTYRYMEFLLQSIAKQEKKPEWVVIDGLEIFTQLCEIMMRHGEGLKYSQGVVNKNIWKQRKLFMRNIHNLALKASTKGIIYTTYTDQVELVESGEMVSKKNIPHWNDIVLYTADIVLYCSGEQQKEGKKFFVTVENSKLDSILRTGSIIDLTNKKISDIAKFEA